VGTLQSVSNDPPVVAGAVQPDLVVTGTDTAVIPVVVPRSEPSIPPVGPKPPLNVVTIVSAIAILGLFAWLFGFMLDRGVPSKDWDRYLALYNSVQSIVAAAVGALLGAQVSAGQAVVARAEGTAAKQRADKLEGNIKSFQADVARAAPGAESGDLSSRERLLARAMALLH
jgi:hypothetical protein